MMGLHGVWIHIVFPELFELQCCSILNAAEAARRRGGDPRIRILLPDVTDWHEVSRLEIIFNDVLLEVDETAELGAIVECPRASLTSGKITEATKLLCIETDSLCDATYG